MTGDTIVVTFPKGLEWLMQEELKAMGLSPQSTTLTSATLGGGINEAMRLCLELRTAHRVLIEIMRFNANDADELYRRINAYSWENLISPNEYLSITSTVDNPSIQDSRFANLKFKDAVVDRIKSKLGKRPNSGPTRMGAVLHLYWQGRECIAYADAAGTPLSRRGYRKIPGPAPLQESLAAALVLSTGWKGQGTFINPMCGSGTLAIEAALIALNKAPGLLKSNYGFMHLKGFDREKWDSMRRAALKAALKSFPGRIIASDIDQRAIDASRKSANTAGVEHLIEFIVSDFADTPVPPGEGVIIMNPPYGDRMGNLEDLALTYARTGDFLKQKCTGKRGYIFTGNTSLAKGIGLRTKSRKEFYNGPIECRLLEYELYQGTRKGG